METRLARPTVIAIMVVACKGSPATGGGDAETPPAASSASAAPSPSTLAQVRALKREAITQIDEYDLDGAKEKLLEAQRLAPNDDDVKKALVTWDEVSALRIGGRWFKQSEKDAMTDQLNIRMITPASNDISTGYSEKRPTIEVRCIKGVPDIMINSRTIIDSDIYSHAKARYRFDSDPPQAIGMVASQDRRGVFFNEPLKWFDRLMAHAGGKLVVEIPVFGQVPEATTFDLTGADVAIPPVKEACASKK